MDKEQLSAALSVLFLIAMMVVAFRRSMKETENKHGKKYANVMYGVWVEVLFTFFPFVAYLIVSAWKNDISHVLKTPELAVAAAILSGQGLLKFLRSVIGIPALTQSGERVVFLGVLGLLLFLIAIVFIVLIAASESQPWFMGYAQILLVALSLPMYSALAGGGELIAQKYATEG